MSVKLSQKLNNAMQIETHVFHIGTMHLQSFYLQSAKLKPQ